MYYNISNFIKNKLFYPTVLLVMLLAAVGAKAQDFHTLYWMQGIPQSIYANPAQQPLPDLYVGLPGISSLYTGINNTGFSPKDILKRDSEGKLYLDHSNLLLQLSERNYFIFGFSNDIFGFGFRNNSGHYLSFNISERVQSRMGYSDDLLQLVLEGNDPFLQNGQQAHLGGLAFDVNHFREYGFGYSRIVDEKLKVGFRAKLLQGLGNIHFKKSNMELITDPVNYQLHLNTDILVNTSLPWQLSPLDQIADASFSLRGRDARRYLTNSGNLGLAIDLGSTYEVSPWVTLAVSVRDLGFISWRTGVENFSTNTELAFNGLNFKEVFGRKENEEDPDFVERITDSIFTQLDIQETNNAYSLGLGPDIFLSATYNLSPINRFAFLAKGAIYGGRMFPSFTVSYNYQPYNRFGSTFSYSIIHGSFHNVGFGIHANLYPVQFYILTDNFFPALQPHTIKNFNLHFGINIATGFRKAR
jgi:hypothetical protein